jgi:multidrug efflux pump subunit AcrA (membrane-fusion protein)
MALAAALLGACQREVDNAAPEARPVRTVTVEKGEASAPIALTGRIEAGNEVALAFRISGRVIENDVKLGEQVQPGRVVAHLESQNELNALRSAQATLAAAEGQLVQADNHFERQKFLLARNVIARYSMSRRRRCKPLNRRSMQAKRS